MSADFSKTPEYEANENLFKRSLVVTYEQTDVQSEAVRCAVGSYSSNAPEK